MGLNPAKRIIMAEVFDAHGCSRYADNGVMMTGPLLIKFGTPAQRECFLPRILSGEQIWCQGYKRAQLGLRPGQPAHRSGVERRRLDDHGQKIWTSRADQAQWCHMLARTDKDAAKPQDGISYFLVPLDAPGVTIRPIKILSMQPDFCEVFFDNVKVPADALVGDVNKGWSVSKALMGGERMFLGAAAQSFNALALLRRIAKATGHLGRARFHGPLRAPGGRPCRPQQPVRGGPGEGPRRRRAGPGRRDAQGPPDGDVQAHRRPRRSRWPARTAAWTASNPAVQDIHGRRPLPALDGRAPSTAAPPKSSATSLPSRPCACPEAQYPT